MNSSLRKKIVQEMARRSRGTDEGDPICLTSYAVADNIKEPQGLVFAEIMKMLSDGLVYRPFAHQQSFLSLTEKGMPKIPTIAA